MMSLAFVLMLFNYVRTTRRRHQLLFLFLLLLFFLVCLSVFLCLFFAHLDASLQLSRWTVGPQGQRENRFQGWFHFGFSASCGWTTLTQTPTTVQLLFLLMFFLFMACNNHLSRAEERKNEKKSGTSKSQIKLVAMALKRSNFLHAHSLHHPHTFHTVHTICAARTLLIICIASFFGSLMMIFSLVSRRLKRLKEPCGNYVQRVEEQGAKRATEREREQSISCASRADRVEPNASNMKKAF